MKVMTLLIKSVRILGGAREYPEPTDLFVNGERISAIGDFPSKKADMVLDGQGAYLSPGFIDVNTDSDHYLTLFEHPLQEDFLKQGVTTIFGGMCGASLAPLLYGSLESIDKWADPDRTNVNWHTMGEFLRALDGVPLGVNFGTLAGHVTVRRAIAGDTARDLTKNELAVLARVLRSALKEGAFGISVGPTHANARRTPNTERKLLADIVKGFGGIYAVHLRDTGEEIHDAVEETIKLTRETKASTLVSHFVPIDGFEKEYEAALTAIDALPGDMNFHFDAYPSESTLLPIYSFLPEWAQAASANVMLANIEDDWFVRRARDSMPQLNENDFIIAQAPNNDFLVGKSLKDVKEMYGMGDGRAALLRLMRTMQMRGGALYRNVVPGFTARIFKDRRSFVASNAPSFAHAAFRGKRIKSENTTRTFIDFLRLVEKEDLMPLADAIAKITEKPALKFGLRGRGRIVEGNFADLTCFKDGEVRFTVVNGAVAMRDGECTGAHPGKALRREQGRIS